MTTRNHRLLVFEGDGVDLPTGQYLITIWDSGTVEMAWREDTDTKLVWHKPFLGEER